MRYIINSGITNLEPNLLEESYQQWDICRVLQGKTRINTDIEIEIPSCLIENKLHTINFNYLLIKVEIVVQKMFYFDVTSHQ